MSHESELEVIDRRRFQRMREYDALIFSLSIDASARPGAVFFSFFPLSYFAFCFIVLLCYYSVLIIFLLVRRAGWLLHLLFLLLVYF